MLGMGEITGKSNTTCNFWKQEGEEALLFLAYINIVEREKAAGTGWQFRDTLLCGTIGCANVINLLSELGVEKKA